MAQIAMIVAVDRNNAIGRDGALLCYLPSDLQHFKAITIGSTIIMGRRTYESLPNGALPGRRNIVLSRNANLKFENCEMALSLDAALEYCQNDEQVFIIGGGEVYTQAMIAARTLYVTRIMNEFEGADVFFPEIDTLQWRKESEEKYPADELNMYAYEFARYVRIS